MYVKAASARQSPLRFDVLLPSSQRTRVSFKNKSDHATKPTTSVAGIPVDFTIRHVDISLFKFISLLLVLTRFLLLACCGVDQSAIVYACRYSPHVDFFFPPSYTVDYVYQVGFHRTNIICILLCLLHY